MARDEMKPYVTMAERAAAEAEAAGFEVSQFSILPGLHGERDKARIVLFIDPDKGAEPERSEDARAVTEMMAATKDAEREERARKAREDLQHRLRNPKDGIL